MLCIKEERNYLPHSFNDTIVIIFIRINFVAAICTFPTTIPIHGFPTFGTSLIVPLCDLRFYFTRTIRTTAILGLIIHSVAKRTHLHLCYLLRFQSFTIAQLPTKNKPIQFSNANCMPPFALTALICAQYYFSTSFDLCQQHIDIHTRFSFTLIPHTIIRGEINEAGIQEIL